LYGLAEGVRVVAVLLHPFMPETCAKALGALGEEDLSLEKASIGAVPGGRQVHELAPLFPRIERAE
jgi:methionyl-tRNA synthetase